MIGPAASEKSIVSLPSPSLITSEPPFVTKKTSSPRPPTSELSPADPVSESSPAPPVTFSTFETALAAPAATFVADPVVRFAVTSFVSE